MNEASAPSSKHRFEKTPHIRRFYSGALRPTRSPIINMAILVAVVAAIAILLYKLLFPGTSVKSDIVDLSKSVEQVQELSTVKSHFRFAVVVQEQSGNILVRRLAEQTEYIGMEDLGTMLFQNPTMIVELHGVATYGMKLNDVARSITQDDSTLTIPLPSATVLDAHLVAADTRIVAQMKGLFRSSNNTLLLEANRRGEAFVRDYAMQDSTLSSLAAERVRSLLGLLVERAGKRAVFVQK